MNNFKLPSNGIVLWRLAFASLTMFAISCSNSADSLPKVAPPIDEQLKSELPLTAEPPTSEPAGDYTDFPSVNIRMVAPANATVAKQFHGFKHNKSNATVMITTTPLAYETVIKEVISEMARYSKTTFDEQKSSTKTVESNGQPGIYAFIKQQKQEGLFGVHIYAFGDENKSWVIKGSLPMELEAELSDEIFKSVMSAKRIVTTDEDPTKVVSDVDFSLTSEMMKPTPGWTKSIVFTKDGVFPLKHPGDPFFKAERPLDSAGIPENQREAFALRVLRPAPNIQIDEVFINREIIVDGLLGREIMALAHTQLAGFGIVLYSAILFEEDSYVVMNGWVGQDVFEDYPAEFKSIVRSYKSRKAE